MTEAPPLRDDVSRPEAASTPDDAPATTGASFRPTLAVWITIAVTGFALLVAVWMYWISGALLGAAT